MQIGITSWQYENGAMCQIYGGCIFKLSWDLLDPLKTIPIRIENPHPQFFVGRPSSRDIWRLREAWIVYPLSPDEAMENGVAAVGDEQYWLCEHYTEKSYEAVINNIPVRVNINGVWRPISGPNPWGFVPIVYIPHIRSYGFYGENDIDPVIGTIKELNLRIADYGDSISADAHAYLGMRNVNGTPQVQQVAPNLFAINLGGSLSALTGQSDQPDLFELRKQSSSDPMENMVKLLYQIYRILAHIPSVADGEDEGSQRSGLTLAMRMIALTSHTNIERIFWTTGLDTLNRMILRMLTIHPEFDSGIIEDHLRMNIQQEWSPVLPRDREMVVQEAVSLIGAKLGSPERLLEMLGVDDVEEEKDLILQFIEEIAEVNMEVQKEMLEAKA